MTDDILFSTIAELAELLKARKISSVELTKAYLDRLEKLGPKYNALATVIRKPAEKQAKEADDNFKRERTRNPLQGIPYGAKDLLATRGIPTTWGAAPYREQVFDYDATVIQKLQKAGAILVAKLAMVELAGGGGYRYPSASMFGPGRNPWNPEHWSGGSSSGSGAAVAAALAPFALGSETSGSILTPAAFCGVTGLRPTYGLVSRYGAMALSWTLDKIGPLCRSAEDCALVLRVIAGKDSNDPASAGKSFYYMPEYGQPLSDLKIGFAAVDFERTPEAARPAFQAALEVFRKMGSKFVETSLPPMPYSEVVGTIIQAEGATIFEPLIKSGKLDLMPDERQKAGLKAGLEMPAKDYLNAMRVRRLMQEKIRQLFTEVDVILSYSRAGPASGINEPLDRGAAPPSRPPEKTEKASEPPRPAGNAALIAAGNIAGLPALSLPCGFSTGTNLPLAVQLVGRPFDEGTLIALGREFQKQTDWHRKRPPVS